MAQIRKELQITREEGSIEKDVTLSVKYCSVADYFTLSDGSQELCIPIFELQLLVDLANEAYKVKGCSNYITVNH